MSSSGMALSSSPKKSSAKRCLFGKSNSGSAFCTRLLEEIIQEKSQHWDFNFMTGVPFASSSTFEYTACPSSSVPGFYRCSALPSSMMKRQTSDSSLSSDSENYDPIPSSIMEADMDSSMEFEDDGITTKKAIKLATPGKPASTPKKCRLPLLQRKRIFSGKKSSASSQKSSLASPNDGKITAHMSLRVSKRIVKKTSTSTKSSAISKSSDIFIFNDSGVAARSA